MRGQGWREAGTLGVPTAENSLAVSQRIKIDRMIQTFSSWAHTREDWKQRPSRLQAHATAARRWGHQSANRQTDKIATRARVCALVRACVAEYYVAVKKEWNANMCYTRWALKAFLCLEKKRHKRTNTAMNPLRRGTYKRQIHKIESRKEVSRCRGSRGMGSHGSVWNDERVPETDRADAHGTAGVLGATELYVQR